MSSPVSSANSVTAASSRLRNCRAGEAAVNKGRSWVACADGASIILGRTYLVGIGPKVQHSKDGVRPVHGRNRNTKRHDTNERVTQGLDVEVKSWIVLQVTASRLYNASVDRTSENERERERERACTLAYSSRPAYNQHHR